MPKSPTNNGKLNKVEVSAKDVKKTAGLSYRQIHTWDSKKALPKSSSRRAGWRKFTGEDIIRLTILSRLTETGIPIGQLGKLASWIKKPTAIEYLLQQLYYGLNMFLYTDLKNNFGFYSESDLNDLIFLDIEHPVIVIPLNKIISNILEKLGIENPKIVEEFKVSNLIKLTGATEKKRSEAEEKIISLIKEKQYQTIVVKVKDGKIAHLTREESFPFDQ